MGSRFSLVRRPNSAQPRRCLATWWCIRFLSATSSKATSLRPSDRSCRKSKPDCPGSRRAICCSAIGLLKPDTRYSGDYLVDSPTCERLLETVERYEEDLTDASRPHPPLHAVISVGEAIEANATRDRSADGDPIANELRRQLEMMLEESKTRRRAN